MNAFFPTLLSAFLLAGGPPSRAHGDQTHPKPSAPAKSEQKPWGIAGTAKAVTRTIQIQMLDSMRFTPDRIEVKQGETVRLTMVNTGQAMHELVLGTQKALAEHAALMKRFPNMEHDEPYMVHVPPGKAGHILWNFNRVGAFDFACLLPGHFDAGMVGKIVVTPSTGAQP